MTTKRKPIKRRFNKRQRIRIDGEITVSRQVIITVHSGRAELCEKQRAPQKSP